VGSIPFGHGAVRKTGDGEIPRQAVCEKSSRLAEAVMARKQV
jgi:hypothetical protein